MSIKINAPEVPSSITVIDPLHPLYGRSLPLVSVHHSRSTASRSFCVAQLDQNTTRRIPIDATNLYRSPPPHTDIPFTTDGLTSLLKTFHHVTKDVGFPTE